MRVWSSDNTLIEEKKRTRPTRTHNWYVDDDNITSPDGRIEIQKAYNSIINVLWIEEAIMSFWMYVD